jgi:hypothetical protein
VSPPNDPKARGELTEVIILAELVKHGYEVLLPWGDNQRYDMALDLGDGRMLRAQCKTGRLRSGTILFEARSVNWNTKMHRDYRGQADVFLVYCYETRKVYWRDVSDVGTATGSLCVDSTQRVAGVHWAADHELPEAAEALAPYLDCTASTPV